MRCDVGKPAAENIDAKSTYVTIDREHTQQQIQGKTRLKGMVKRCKYCITSCVHTSHCAVNLETSDMFLIQIP